MVAQLCVVVMVIWLVVLALAIYVREVILTSPPELAHCAKRI